jgi:hypothetical protein
VPVIALADIYRLEVKKTDVGRTMGLILGVPVAVLGAVIAVECLGSDSFFCE